MMKNTVFGSSLVASLYIFTEKMPKSKYRILLHRSKKPKLQLFILKHSIVIN
jgi:hypothetical protein